MGNGIWDVLGIKPTKDKKIIQQAYADKLKLFHPEDEPEKFQQLQEAYRLAVAYSKRKNVQSYGRNVESNKPLFSMEPEMEETKTEYVPDYIAKIKDTDTVTLNASEIGKYVKILKEQFRTKKGDENLDLLVSLFDSIQFRNIIALDEFLECLKKEMASTEEWNSRTIDILLARINHIKREEPDKDYKELIEYLESQKGMSTLAIVVLCIVAFFARALFKYYMDH